MSERGGGRAKVLVGLGLLTAAALVTVVLVVWVGDGSESSDERAVRAAAARFATAVGNGEPGRGGTVQPAVTVDAEFAEAVEGLGGVDVRVVPGPATIEGDRATVPLRSRWRVGGAEWTSSGRLRLERTGDDWRSRWELAALDDRLRRGDSLAAERTPTPRAAILDGDGQRLVAPRPVVVVGVEPRRATDVDALVAELARLLDIDAESLATRIRAAPDGAFVEVITLRREDYEPLRLQLQPLPGTVFRAEEQLLAPSRSFARALLGTVGPATADQVAASAGRLVPGELTGQSGLQARYDDQLRGTPGLVVRVVRPDDGSDDDVDAEERPLETVQGTPGTDVRTTLDLDTQRAGESALAAEGRASALVALRVSTSEVLAVANAPEGTTATVGLTARVPPGSTFKVVSTLALLRRGTAPTDRVVCPARAAVGGRSFKNAGDFALGETDFRTAFARSCNTAFVALSERLAPIDLTEAGKAFGLGVDWPLGLPVETGSVPPTEGPVDQAAASIGQGRLVTSPMGMAAVAATVGAGRWRAPSLVSTPPEGARPPDVALRPGEAETLRSLMRAVVTDGSGAALRGVPGGPVAAKTGTAEFGNDDPPRSHAWVIGIQGDVAFAVFVEGGESGGEVAAPIGARFLTTLRG